MFTALKGAMNNELDVSHAEKRFLRYDNETKFSGRSVIKYPERNVVKFLKNPATNFPRNRVAKFPRNAKKRKKKMKVEEDEEVEDNDDGPGTIRACLDAKLAKDSRKPVAKFPSRFATRSPRTRFIKFPEKPANTFPRKTLTKLRNSL